MKLSEGFIDAVLQDTYKSNPDFLKPTLLVSNIKQTQSQETNEIRFRMILSDGINQNIAMLLFYLIKG